MKHAYLSSFGCIVVALLLSCNNRSIYNLPAEIAEAAHIKNGSYFVYKDSITGALDSFTTVDYLDELKLVTKSIFFSTKTEYYQEIIFSMLDTSQQKISFKANTTQATNCTAITLFITDKGVGTAMVDPMLYDSISLYEYASSKAFSRVINKYPIITIQQQVYNNVFEILTTSYVNTDTQYVHTFFSTTSGLVKYRTRNNNDPWVVKELIRSEINR
jgi:hypothetical protein